MTLSARAYIRQRRIAHGLSIEDVAIALETVPEVSARTRGEWLTSIEDGAAPLSIGVALLLRERIGFDWNILLALSAIEAGIPIEAPTVCRGCACSEWDPCELAGGAACGWAFVGLCTVCRDREQQAAAA